MEKLLRVHALKATTGASSCRGDERCNEGATANRVTLYSDCNEKEIYLRRYNKCTVSVYSDCCELPTRCKMSFHALFCKCPFPPPHALSSANGQMLDCYAAGGPSTKCQTSASHSFLSLSADRNRQGISSCAGGKREGEIECVCVQDFSSPS
jgi:hypothetical protein